MCDSHVSSHYSLHKQTLKLTIALYRVTDYFPKSEILRNDLRAKANEIFQQVTEYNADINREKIIESLIWKVRTIKGYLEIANALHYAHSLNFAVLKKEYDFIEQFFEIEKTKHIQQSVFGDIKNERRNFSVYGHAGRDNRNPERKKEIKENHPNDVARNSTIERGGSIASETELLDKGFHEMINARLNERQKVIMDHLTKLGRGKISDFYTSLKGVSSKTIQRDLQNLVDKAVLKKEGEKRWTVYSIVRN